MPESIADVVKQHLMAGAAPFVDEEAKASAKQAAEEKARMHTALVHLSGLKEHEGWRLFKEQLDNDYEAAVQACLRETDGVKLARASGAAFALRVARDWVDNQVRGIHDALK